jgi:site-specific recombinase XerD
MCALNLQDQGTIVLSQQDYLPFLIESFLVDRRSQGLSPDTISFYRKKLRYFEAYCEAQAITQASQVTPDLIRRYILQLAETHNQGGVHACFRPLRTLLLWVESEEIMPLGWRNPIRRVKAPKIAIEPIEPIGLGDVRALAETCQHDYCGTRDKPMILGLLDTAARAQEFRFR